MYVPNYIPEPEQVPGNLTMCLYRERLSFIRKVLYRFFGSVGMVVGVGLLIQTNLDLWKVTYGVLTLLLAVSGVRTVLRGTPTEARLTTALMPLVIVGVAFLGRAWANANFPAWAILAGLSCFALYASLCGRDFSFVGGYVLSLIVSSVFIAFIMVEEGMTSQRSVQALTWNALGLFYIVYDLAALLSRRKPDESWAATVDLFRDIFNFLGYFPRVMIHWNRHRILGDLSIDNPFRNTSDY